MCETTTGNNTVHMYMVIQFLIQGMKYLNDTGCCAEILPIGRKLEKCFCAASVEQAVKQFLVAVNKVV